MATSPTANTKKRSFCESYPNDQSNKRRKVDSGASVNHHEKRILNVRFRFNITFQMPIDDEMTVGMFKQKFKSYAAKLIMDFDVHHVENEHLLIEMATNRSPGRIALNNDGALMKNALDSCTDTVYVEEAKGILVTVPGKSDKHGLFVFPSRAGYEFKYRIYELMEKQHVHFGIFKVGEDKPFGSFADLKNGDELEVRLDTIEADSKITVTTPSQNVMEFQVSRQHTMRDLMWQIYIRLRYINMRGWKFVLDGIRLQHDHTMDFILDRIDDYPSDETWKRTIYMMKVNLGS